MEDSIKLFEIVDVSTILFLLYQSILLIFIVNSDELLIFPKEK